MAIGTVREKSIYHIKMVLKRGAAGFGYTC